MDIALAAVGWPRVEARVTPDMTAISSTAWTGFRNKGDDGVVQGDRRIDSPGW